MERSRQWAVKHGYDYILIVQSDIIFPPETLLVLIEKMKEHKVGVICPLTPERPEKVGTDDFVVCMSWNGNPHARKNIEKGGDFEVTGNGSGYMCVLVHRDVFSKISFPVMGNSDVNWYRKLRESKIKMVCEVSLRIFHKQRDGKIIRGNKYVLEHWKQIIEEDEKQGYPWFYRIPRRWWWGRSKEEFLQQLPDHMEEESVFWSW